MQEVAGSGPVYRSIERDAGFNPAGSPWAVSKAALLNLHISGKARALCANIKTDWEGVTAPGSFVNS